MSALRMLSALVIMAVTTAFGCGARLESSSRHECEAGETTCNDYCVDTRTSPSNCGRCEYFCGSAPCNSGVCGETPLIVVQGTATSGLTADATTLYWVTLRTLHSMPLEGETEKQIASLDPSDGFRGPIAVFGGRVYASTAKDRILSVSVNGGIPDLVASGVSASGLAADETGVYWSQQSPGELWRSQGKLSSNVLVASGLEYPGRIVLDTDYIYWSNHLGSVMRIPKQGGTPTEVASGASYELAVNSQGLLYASEDSVETRLMLLPRNGGPARLLFACRGKTNEIAADEQGIYWSGCSARGVLAFPPEGGAERGVFGSLAGRMVAAGNWLFLLESIDGPIYRVRRSP